MPNQNARRLRNSMSNAERKLWNELRLQQLDGARFRRQNPIGPYIVDFVCLEKRLVVEVDGEQHTFPEHVALDERRDRWLTAEGYRVMRFQTIDVYRNLPGVVYTIWGALQEMPTANRPMQHQVRRRR
jgi:very-short-patch-repair endonuclease